MIFWYGSGNGNSTGSGRMVTNTLDSLWKSVGMVSKAQENNPGKYIHCKRGDVWISADDGDVVLSERTLESLLMAAPDGDFSVNTNKVANVKSEHQTSRRKNCDQW